MLDDLQIPLKMAAAQLSFPGRLRCDDPTYTRNSFCAKLIIK